MSGRKFISIVSFQIVKVLNFRETFPLLRNKTITRCEWNMIRRLLGKPRRCSPAFFAEERESLEARRQKVRTLQDRVYIFQARLHP